MTTDRELLELAAKAAGYSLGDGWDECGEGYGVIVNGTGRGDGEFWNPLTDDGDNARLETKCLFNVIWYLDFVAIQNVYLPTLVVERFIDHAGDRNKARRYASTRAAAAIGKEK